MNQRRSSRGETIARLQALFLAFDESAQPPSDIFERIKGPRPEIVTPRRRPRRWSTAALSAASVASIAVGGVAGAWWMDRTQSSPALATKDSVVLTVYNAEKPCQRLRTIECGIGIVKDPRVDDPGNVIARAWHGDKLTATCVVADGEKITDEESVSSLRWYRVDLPGGHGYYPGARTRNPTEVPLCGE